MAQLSCPSCYQGGWTDCNVCDHGGSNMSLNMPPMWMGTWHGPPPSMYPYPVPAYPGHFHSRPPSPTHSIKSRKSTLSKKSRKKYRDTDDEDEEEDRRSIFSHSNERGERRSLGRYPDRVRSSREASSMQREVPRRNTMDRLERVSNVRSRHSVRDSSSNESDDEQSESQKESEALEEDSEKIGEPQGVITEVPESNWECEHCTFVNEAGTRVCSVCCKTPTSSVKLIPETRQILNPKNLPKSKPNKEIKLQRSRSSDDYSKDYSETESLLNKMGKINLNEKKLPSPEKKGRSRKISFWPGTKFSLNK